MRNRKHWFPAAETQITKTCITYLSFDVFESGYCDSDKEFIERFRLNPLFHYAALNWGYHAQQAATCDEEVITFLTCEIKIEASGQVLGAELLIPMFRSTGNTTMAPRKITGLHVAAFFGFENGTKALLRGGVEPDPTDGSGFTPLFRAARHGHHSVVKLLLDTGAVDVNVRVSEGGTPLSWAARFGHTHTVRLLLEADDIEVDSKDQGGRTPLSGAAMNGREDIINLLLDTGKVNPNSRCTDLLGYTPLVFAVVNWEEVAVRRLLDSSKVDPDFPTHDGRTPLSMAAGNGNLALIKLFLNKDNINPESRDHIRWTPLWHAARNGHHMAVMTLLSSGNVDPDSRNYYGFSPLSIAVQQQDTEVIKRLLETGRVNFDSRNNFGLTPLWYARSSGNVLSHLLLEHAKKSGISCDQKDLATKLRVNDGWGPYCDS